MPHHAGRKTISMNRKVFDRFKQHCAARNLSMSGIVEKLVADITGGPPERSQPGRTPKIERQPGMISAPIPGAPPPHGTRGHYVSGGCRCHWCRAANAAYAKGRPHPHAIEISEATHSMLRDRVVRELELGGVLTTPSLVAEEAINRMLDTFEQFGMGAVA